MCFKYKLSLYIVYIVICYACLVNTNYSDLCLNAFYFKHKHVKSFFLFRRFYINFCLGVCV